MAIEVKGVTKKIVERLRDQIISGDLSPGQKLNEIRLSSNLDVSRPPLREAFRILENEGLVVSVPRKGCYVEEISSEDFRAVFQARKMIEIHALFLIEKKKISNFDDIDLNLAKSSILSESLPGSDQRLNYLRAFSDFHFKLVKSAENSWLTRFYQAINSNLLRYQFLYAYLPGMAQTTQKDHEKILRFIKKRSFEKARFCLENHIDTYIRLLEKRTSEMKSETNLYRTKF